MELALHLSSLEMNLLAFTMLGLYLVALALLAMANNPWRAKVMWVILILALPIAGSLLFLVLYSFWPRKISWKVD
ncbi:hypothetical protein [Dyadobacter tibetensis]|uniref:hypothetical protein n=1 Tax=Dyadobacter tibetensis TaxID=1211851 RepID=UPI000470D919|nr:hypothetical protein [Dyadobacter tibetensis]